MRAHLVMQFLIALSLVSFCRNVPGVESEASDHAAVQALLRIPDATIQGYPHQAEAVQRHVGRLMQKSPSEFVEVVDQLNVPDQSEALQRIMLDPESGQAGIDATRMLVKSGKLEALTSALATQDDRLAAAAATAIGFVNSKEAANLLRPVMEDSSRHATVRSAAASALGRSWYGQQILLSMARDNRIPQDFRFEISNALLGSWTKEIADEAKDLKSLVSPAAAASESIPPINKLIQMRGDGKEGKKVFETVGTCSKCHKVRGEGKEVGPDLSEIGSKLSREDLYVNILNPSAAVSHNYETYALLTVDGSVITGILINQTDDAVTLKTADAILKTVPADEIEQLKKQSASLMPADLPKSMSVQNLLDLVDYLVLLKKPDETPFHVLASPDANDQKTINSRDAADAVASLDIAPGVVAQLFASEPQMLSPTSIDVDHLGRVWVCEAVNYRHFRNPYNAEREQGDRILVLEDTNEDGKADHSTVFYQGTDIDSPHGICVLGERIIVSAGDRVISFLDSDGDLKPDEKTVLFSGIGGVQHDHGIHSFMPGPDGKLYFNFGNEGKQLADGDGNPVIDQSGREVNDSRKPYQQGMVFRCDPDGTNVETLGWNFRNNWEVCVDSFGTLWQSDNDDDGNRGVRINYVMEYGNYGYRDEQTGATWKSKRIGMREEIGERHWHLNDPGVVPNLLQTGAGSPTGIIVYEGKLLPPAWRNQMIHCDPGPNVVRAYPVENDGAGYSASMATLMKGTRDQWFRPVDVCTAPDGSLLIADWYDPGVGGHRMGDSSRGRLFRVTVKDHQKYKIAALDLSTVEGALEGLFSPNQSTRYLAGEALQRHWSATPPNVNDYLDPAKTTSARMRARLLWQFARVPSVSETAIDEGLKDPNPNIRIAAIRAAKQHDDGRNLAIARRMADDASPQVRREVAILLRGQKSAEAAEIWTKLALQHDGQDRWYLEALGIGADGQWNTFFQEWIDQVGNDWNQPQHRDIIWRARTPAACKYLTEIIATTESAADQQRYFRALDFHHGPEKITALESLVAR